MTLGIFCDFLKDRGYRIPDEIETGVVLSGIRCEGQGQGETSDNDADQVLIISGSDKPAGELTKRYRVVIITGEAESTGLKMIYAPAGTSEGVAAADASAAFTEYDRWYTMMLKNIIIRAPHQVFLKTAYKKIRNPIFLLDEDYSVKAAVGERGIPVQSGSKECSQWMREVKKKVRRIVSGNTDPKEPYSFEIENGKYRCILEPVIVDRIIYGYIVMLGMECPFTAGQIDYLMQCAEVLSEYQKNNGTDRLPFRHCVSFNELLKGNKVSEELIKRDLKTRGWNPTGCFQLLVIRPTLNVRIEAVLYLERQIAFQFSEWMTSSNQLEVVAICSKEEYLERGQSDSGREETLKEFVQKNNLCCGMSSIFRGYSSLHDYYPQARFAAEHCSSAGIFHYEDCQKDHIVSLLRASGCKEALIHPAVKSMCEDGQGEYIEDLVAYLICGKNVSAAAKLLHLNRNSLLYRLKKVSNMLGTDLTMVDEKEGFYYLISGLLV